MEITMLNWLMNNWGTLLIIAVVAVAVIVAIVVIKRDKKKGISSCGGSCGNCGMNCHGAQNNKAE